MAEDIGHTIGALLATQHKSSYWLAKQTGLSIPYIDKLRAGKIGKPSHANLTLIAHALGFSNVDALEAAQVSSEGLEEPPIELFRSLGIPAEDVARAWPHWSLERRALWLRRASVFQDSEKQHLEERARLERERETLRSLASGDHEVA